MPAVSEPIIKPEVYRNKTRLISEMLNGEDPYTYFFDRYEYPPEGGILAYKFGGELIQKEGEPHIHLSKVENLEALEAEELKLGYVPTTRDVRLCQKCEHVRVIFVPKPEILNKVDLLYPEKGFTNPYVVEVMNIAKKELMGFVRLVTMRPVLLLVGLMAVFPLKIKVRIVEKWMDGFNQVSLKLFHQHYIEEKYFCPFVREMIKFGRIFFTTLGFSKGILEEFILNIAMLIEFDPAYRIRMEDLATETNKEALLKNPRKEIVRILGILQERDTRLPLRAKFYAFGQLIRLTLLYPPVRRAFDKAVKESQFENFQLDEADRYHILRLGSYKFQGRHWKERLEEYHKRHNWNPPLGTPFHVLTEKVDN